MSEMSRAWGAINRDIDKKIEEHRKCMFCADYHNACVVGLLEAQGIVANHIGSD